jgi:hypothetical protein
MQDQDSLQIRPAHPDDAERAAVLLYSAYTHTQVSYPLEDEHAGESIVRLQHYFRQDGNRISYQYVQVAEKRSAVVGLVVRFGGREEPRPTQQGPRGTLWGRLKMRLEGENRFQFR